MSINKAIILAAGAGTRLLPSTKAQPKEMLPVGRKPLVQYVVEELKTSGVGIIIFITGRRKRAIEDHFDRDTWLRTLLANSGRERLLEELQFERGVTGYYYTRQSEQLGTGHAVGCARHFTADDPFIVAFGDVIVTGTPDRPLVQRLIDTYENAEGSCVIGFHEVPDEATKLYGVAKCGGGGDVFEVLDLVEKPAPGTAPSNLAVAARYVLPPDIYDVIDETPPAENGEIQLTETLRLMIKRGRKVIGVKISDKERRCDIGNFASYYRTFVDFALADEELGADLAAYLKDKLASGPPY